MLKQKNKDVCRVVCFNKKLVGSLKTGMPQPAFIDKVAGIFSIVGDKTRVKILFILSGEKELCVCDIANTLGLTISATSHQLRKLRDRGVVKYRNDGNMVYYTLEDKHIEELLIDAFKHVRTLMPDIKKTIKHGIQA